MYALDILQKKKTWSSCMWNLYSSAVSFLMKLFLSSVDQFSTLASFCVTAFISFIVNNRSQLLLRDGRHSSIRSQLELAQNISRCHLSQVRAGSTHHGSPAAFIATREVVYSEEVLMVRWWCYFSKTWLSFDVELLWHSNSHHVTFIHSQWP